MITAQELKSLLHYNPDTGIFTWLVNRSNGVKAGYHPYTIDENGYLKFRVLGIRYYAHRLAWLYMTNKFPINQIDHINRKPIDNRFSNLRDVTTSINKQNQVKAQANSKTGVLGVSKHYNGFVAVIYLNRKSHNLGTFKNISLAKAAYMSAKKIYHPSANLEK